MEKQSSSSLSTIIISFLAGACFTAVGFFGYQYLQARNHTVKYNLPTPSPRSELKTYEGKNFSFQYPSGWDLTETVRVFVVEDSSRTIEEYLEKADKISSTAYEGSPSIQVKTTKDTVINGLSCIQREEYLLAADLTQTTTYFKNESTIVSLSLVPNSGISITEDEAIYNQVLSTFRFD